MLLNAHPTTRYQPLMPQHTYSAVDAAFPSVKSPARSTFAVSGPKRATKVFMSLNNKALGKPAR